MTQKETKIKLKLAKSGSEISQALLDHFRSQPYYKSSKILAKPAFEDPTLTFDGRLF